MSVSITHMNEKLLRDACWEAGKRHLEDMRDEMRDGEVDASDRDLLCYDGMHWATVHALAVTLCSRYTSPDNLKSSLGALNAVIDGHGPLEATELADDLYQASAIHATAIVRLAADSHGDARLVSETLRTDLGRAMEAALAERYDGKGREIEASVAEKAKRWEELGRFSVGHIDPARVAVVAREMGLNPTAEECEKIALDGTENFTCSPNHMPVESVREMVDDQIRAELAGAFEPMAPGDGGDEPKLDDPAI